MNKLVLANSSYIAGHLTDEGNHLQCGLQHAGWTLAGFGYGDDCVDVPTLVKRFKPEIVFVQDVREWHSDFSNCLDPRIEFKNWEWLGNQDDIRKVTVLKDAASCIEYQGKFSGVLGADTLVTYYHDSSFLSHSRWASQYHRVRTYHTVDANLCETIDMLAPRRRGIVSGATSAIYPLRQVAFANANELNIDALMHPGYRGGVCGTPDYLRLLSGYKVAICCSSRFGFALRKIIEAVAVGCIVITDLPEIDALPAINAALVRVPTDISVADLKSVIDEAEGIWNEESAVGIARRCREFYDWRAAGIRLDRALTQGMN